MNKKLIKEIKNADEEWKDIYLDEELSKYKISNYGRIMSFHGSKPKILKSYKMKNGYHIICLCSNKGIKHWLLIHRLVAIYFIPIPLELKRLGYTFESLEVNHKNGTYDGKSINTVYNLEWVTSSENKYHAYRTGLKNDADKHPEAIYTNEQITKVCELLEENKLGVRDIMKITDVDYPTIAQVLSGNQWKSISKNFDFSHRKKQRHLYPEDVIQHVKELLSTMDETGMTYSEIGKICGMNRTSVWYLHKKQGMSSTTRES